MLHSETVGFYIMLLSLQVHNTRKKKKTELNIMQHLKEPVPMTWRLSSDKRSTAAATASASFVLVCCCLCLWITYRSSMRSRWILNPSTPTGFLSREGSKCWTAASTCQFEKNHKGHSSTFCICLRLKSLRQMQIACFQKMCH